jgi:hypothetical protein
MSAPSRLKIAAVLLAALFACKSDPPWTKPEPPSDQREAYFGYLLQVMPATLEKVTCHCCRKSLAKCYRDMSDPNARPKCPFG